MTERSIAAPQPTGASVQWQREHPGRRSLSEADAYEADVERYSTTPHEHVYARTAVYPNNDGVDALELCIYCAGWRERIEGRVK